MSSDAVTTSLSRIIALLDEAQACLAGLGPAAGNLSHHLEAALTEARAVESRGGEPDEGLRLDQLTTDNDK